MPPPGWAPPPSPPPPAQAGTGWERLRNVASEWLGDTLSGLADEVADGLSLVAQVEEKVKVNISNTRRTITVKVNFPMEVANDVLLEQGSLDEFSRLVGVKVGAELAQAFRDAEYGDD
jgi:hypothetical protein